MPLEQEKNNIIEKRDLPIVNETINSVSDSTLNYLGEHWVKTIGIIGLTTAIEVFAILGDVRDIRAYLYPLIIPLIGYTLIKSKVEDEFMKQFAEVNGYTYGKSGTYGKGYLFQLGHSNTVSDRISGQYNGYPIELYLYSYTVGSGRSSHTYNHTVFSLEFNTVMPDIVLTDKGSWFSESLVPSNTSVIKLEGDFDKYFNLHVPKGYEVEALEVFTPDVMAKLIDKARFLNLEIFENSLYIYSDGFIQDKEKLYAMYELARYLTDELGPVLAGMKPALEATEEFKSEILK